MVNNLHNGDTIAGTVGGTLLVIFLNADYKEMMDTALLAAIGAAVSFIVSALLKFMINRFFILVFYNPIKGAALLRQPLFT